jgi:GWxTD domain-containing protein
MSASIGLLVGALLGSINFSLDQAAFRAGRDSSRVEFFYAIPYDQLLYTVTDSGVVALFSVSVEMAGIGNDFREQGTIHKRARIASFQEAERARRTFVDGFSIVAPPGRYRSRVTVMESTPGGVNEGTRDDSLSLAGFARGLALSSLQLGASAVTDTATGAVSVIPGPGRSFASGGAKVVYVYFEGYNLEPDTDRYQVRFAIVHRAPSAGIPSGVRNPDGGFRGSPGFRASDARDGRADTLVRTPPMIRGKSGASVAAALGVSIDGVGPGDYDMALALTDLSTGQTVFQQQAFSIRVPESPQGGVVVKLDSLNERERKYYKEIQYIATPREIAYYRALSDSGKLVWLASFWSRHNLAEYARRMETAETKFRRQRTSGANTDRGRIYVKYGEPDAVEQKVIETDLRPREYWHYYSAGYVFVFIDIRGDGNYRLAYTTNKDEPPTGFEQYLSSDELDQWEK